MRRPAAALLAATLALTMTACQQPDAHGTVTAKIHRGKWRYLVTRQSDGQTAKVRVGLLSHAWRHCHVGDQYPQCDR